MDTESLVEENVDAGRKLISRFLSDGFDVTAACWLKTSEEGEWLLYVASDNVDKKGLAAAYREAYGALQDEGDDGVSMSQLKLISPSNPIALDVLDIHRRYPARIATRTRRPQFGNVTIDEAYIYPPETYNKRLADIMRKYPSAEAFAILIPAGELFPASGLLGPFSWPGAIQRFEPYMGKINDAVFEGKAPETVWFAGLQGSSKDLLARLVFVHRPEGWNKLFRPDTNTWEEVIHVATKQKLYEAVDFGPLAALKIPD